MRELNLNEYEAVSGGLKTKGQKESSNVEDCRDPNGPCYRNPTGEPGGDWYPVDKNGDMIYD